uniref:Sodium/potassium-transporting ATPase subunit beta n=1 Tax=Elaeophora elaphi TaxID=1147741 RepID=A0A0R3RTH6_9BILA
MATMRYECVSNSDSLAIIDQTNVYNTEQIDDTALITSHNDNFDHIFMDDITWQNIFQDIRYSQRQQRFCMGIIISMICIMLILLVSLFSGFGKVIFDVVAYQEKSRYGLMMIPNVRKRSLNVFYFNVRNETANAEYVKEIDDYLAKYAKDGEMMGEFLKICAMQERSDRKRWCAFDIQQQFHSDCSKTTNYGYNSGNPCVLFIFENRLGWKPNMKSEMSYLPFFCRMQYQYSSNIYTNITYYPSLPAPMHGGGFQMNLIPNQKITDDNGNEIVGKDGNTLYTLPPLVMAKMTFLNALKRDENVDLGPFTMDCRIKDNVAGYQFDNIQSFNGQTAISFDFVPQFS